MSNSSQFSRWFCRKSLESPIEGPYYLVEMAGLLRSGDIKEDTLTRKDGEDSWKAFRDTPEFESAKNIPAAVIAEYRRELPEPPLEPWWTPRRLYYLGTVVVGSLGGLFISRRGYHWEIDITWLLRPAYHLVRRMLGH